MAAPHVDAFFLPRDEQSLFCLLFNPPPGRRPRGAVLHVPAFAEEMNKSRRAVANAARALAMEGWQVLVFDLHGTGDSTAEFADASWAGWLADIRAANGWLRQHAGTEPVLWGLRAGCLLVSDILDELPATSLIYWQPLTAGDAALTQMLRLRTMAAANAGAQKETTRTLLEALERGETLQIAGYDLPPSVAMPLRAARLRGEVHAGRHVSWLEIAVTEPPECSPASARRIEELGNHGAQVAATAVAGVPFWSTVEIDEARQLVAATASWAGRGE